MYSERVQRLALACLLLIACFSFAEATHLHSVASPDGDRYCDFCLVAHAGIAAVPVASAAIAVQVTPTQVLRTEDSKPTAILRGSDLYIRPPPLV